MTAFVPVTPFPVKKAATVREIVVNYLTSCGLDGLAGDECGCSKDDLFPCGHFGLECRPARLIVCSTCERKNTVNCFEYPGDGDNGPCLEAVCEVAS